MDPTEALRQRLETADRNLLRAETRRDETTARLEAVKAELLHLTTEKILTEKVEQVLQVLAQSALGQATTTIDTMLTSGLRLVFDDQDLSFHSTTDRSRGKTSIKFILRDKGVEKPLMESYGGGVLVVAAVLLRITTIMALGLKRVLLLDESLSHLSAQYVPNASRLLKRLCEELDFTVVMVTHQEEFATYADRHYKAIATQHGTKFLEEKKPHA